MRATAVIGAGFGDEGKGLLTDYYAAQAENPLVVRFNGGAQAGHTVCTPDGRRHVFSHFGSGSFLGIPTILAKEFIVNPGIYVKELSELKALKLFPHALVDERALVSLPLDGIINQLVEASRGSGRHGSCGVGIFECIERSKRHCLTMANVFAHKTRLENVAYCLFRIAQKVWLPQRLVELQVKETDHTKPLLEIARSMELFERWLEELMDFREHVDPFKAIPRNANVIFEGAQGLLLDQNNHGWFPYLTPSNTGLANVHRFAEEHRIDELDVTYATRCYLTRHGAGPLPHELRTLPYSGIRDETNLPNKHQGELRFAYLDIDLLKAAIIKDVQRTNLPTTTTLAVTCLDQTDHVKLWERGALHTYYKTHDVPEYIKNYVGVEKAIGVYGPTRNDVGSLVLV